MDNAKTKNAKWLDDLKISKASVDKLSNTDSYFSNLLNRFNDELTFKFKCNVVCKEIDLMAQQEIDTSVVTNIPLVTRNFTDIKSLSSYVDTYNYQVSPEMKFYFQHEFSVLYPNVTYSEVTFSPGQFLKLFDSSKLNSLYKQT